MSDLLAILVPLLLLLQVLLLTRTKAGQSRLMNAGGAMTCAGLSMTLAGQALSPQGRGATWFLVAATGAIALVFALRAALPRSAGPDA